MIRALSLIHLIWLLSVLTAPQLSFAATKSSAVRLKHVNQSLEAIAGRLRSTRSLSGTGELATGALFTYTGVGLIIGTAKFMNQPNLAATGNFSVDLGEDFRDAYSRVPGAILGYGVGGLLTYMGLRLGSGGVNELFHPSEEEHYFYDQFQKLPQKNDMEITQKADQGEKRLMEFAHQARHDRLFYGWATLGCGALMLAAATAHPEQPAGFFLGGGAGVYGFVSLLTESQTEDEYADFVAWETDTPRDNTSNQHKGWTLAALPTPGSLALGASFSF